MKDKLKEMLNDWHDPYDVHEIQDAEEIIHLLEIELAGKNAVIDALHDDLDYYKRDRKDQMIQDQGLEE